MRRPAIEDIAIACEWLEINEGDAGEAEACAKVAAWLKDFAWKAEDRAAREAAVRKIARDAGCSMKVARAALKRQHAA